MFAVLHTKLRTVQIPPQFYPLILQRIEIGADLLRVHTNCAFPQA